MTALEKLITLKRVLDWNLSTKSGDILPIINEVIAILKEQEEKPVTIEDKKETKATKEPKTTKPKQEENIEEIKQEVNEEKEGYDLIKENPIEIKEEKSMEELRKEYKEKFNKNPFGGWNREILESKLK